MDEQGNRSGQPGIISTRRMLVMGGAIAVFLVVAFVITYLYSSGALRSAPRVEAQAENRYYATLHVVTDIDYEPFSYLDENGDYAGLDVELINEIANRLEMNLDFELLDWDSVNERFTSGEADAILNMETDSVAASDTMIATIPTAEKQYVVYGRETISSVAELYGRKVASLHRLPELGLEHEITYLGSYAEIFEALKAGEYDFAICPIQVGNVFLQKLDIQDVQPSYAVGHVYGAIALHPQDEALKDRLDSVISELDKEGYLDELDEKWISHRYQTMTLGGMIAEHPEIAVVFLFAVLMAAFLFVYTLLQRRNALAQVAYTQRLRENLDTIEQQQEELIEAKQQAEASSRAKTAFLFNMSHDLRTPMNAIIGYTNLAQREGVDADEMRGFLGKIDSSSQHLLTLINDVLEMSRIESGKMELEPVETDLGAVMDGIRDMFATQMESKGIVYHVAADQVTHRRVLCDKSRLDRVLLNLVSNAYKFTPEGGRVDVELRETGAEAGMGSYELRVADTGIGMSPEFAAKVFDAFERERTSTVSGIQGTGLGMAITKSIVEVMGGRIDVRTEQGTGTEFAVHVELPLCAQAGDVPSDEPDQAAAELDFTSMKLLLVEDNELNREIAEMILDEVGFAVDTAENGQIAVDKVAASAPGDYDAILMDVQMPVMDGYAATRAIRALSDPALASIPIIACTANAFAEDVNEATEAGMDRHIAKPLDVGVLMDTLADVLTAR